MAFLVSGHHLPVQVWVPLPHNLLLQIIDAISSRSAANGKVY